MNENAITNHGTTHDTLADPETLTDRQLFQRCQAVGGLALKSRREFIGLLPLAERRRVYEGHGLYSIYDFAAKLGGISQEMVREVLRVDSYLVDTPKLRKKLYRGEIGWSKIRIIVHWVTKSNEDEWIQKLENLSKQALEVYLRDYQNQQMRDVPTLWTGVQEQSLSLGKASTNKDILENGVKSKAEFLPGEEMKIENKNLINQENIGKIGANQAWPASSSSSPTLSRLDQLAMQRETFTFSMRSDIAARLRLFRQKLEKDRRELVTWEEVMTEFLKMIEGEMRYGEMKRAENKSEKEIKKAEEKIEKKLAEESEKPATRAVPAHVRHALDAQYEGMCAFRDCTQPATSYHHTRRFALTSHLSQAEVHDSKYIKPLCTPHERIIHNTLIENEECDPSTWKVLAKPDLASDRADVRAIDEQVMKYRKPG